jgi:hypothetical protein
MDVDLGVALALEEELLGRVLSLPCSCLETILCTFPGKAWVHTNQYKYKCPRHAHPGTCYPRWVNTTTWESVLRDEMQNELRARVVATLATEANQEQTAITSFFRGQRTGVVPRRVLPKKFEEEEWTNRNWRIVSEEEDHTIDKEGIVRGLFGRDRLRFKLGEAFTLKAGEVFDADTFMESRDFAKAMHFGTSYIPMRIHGGMI